MKCSHLIGFMVSVAASLLLQGCAPKVPMDASYYVNRYSNDACSWVVKDFIYTPIVAQGLAVVYDLCLHNPTLDHANTSLWDPEFGIKCSTEGNKNVAVCNSTHMDAELESCVDFVYANRQYGDTANLNGTANLTIDKTRASHVWAAASKWLWVDEGVHQSNVTTIRKRVQKCVSTALVQTATTMGVANVLNAEGVAVDQQHREVWALPEWTKLNEQWEENERIATHNALGVSIYGAHSTHGAHDATNAAADATAAAHAAKVAAKPFMAFGGIAATAVHGATAATGAPVHGATAATAAAVHGATAATAAATGAAVPCDSWCKAASAAAIRAGATDAAAAAAGAAVHAPAARRLLSNVMNFFQV